MKKQKEPCDGCCTHTNQNHELEKCCYLTKGNCKINEKGDKK